MKYWLLSGLLVAACWSRPVPPAPDRAVTIGVEPTSFRLDNGLRVVLVRDPRAMQVSVTVEYAVGAADDPLGSEGLAHVVEHVMYEPLIDGASLMTRLQDTALDFNGFTGPDATTYTERGWPAQLGELLAIETARLDQRCASLTDDAFAHAREIVRNELRERGGSWEVLAALDSAVFPVGHPYHRAAPTLATLGSITREQACAFADAHYGTNNAVLVVSGPVDRDQLVAALHTTLERVHREVRDTVHDAPPIQHRHQRIAVPLKSPALVIGWPAPDDPVQRTQLAPVMKMFATLISTRVNASTSLYQLGGTRGRMLAIVLRPNAGIDVDEVLGGAERGRAMTWYGTALFEAARGRAVYDVVDDFDAGVERDQWIAEQVFAGRDPQQTLQARIAALHAMSIERANALANTLPFDGATIVTLDPDPNAHTEAAGVAPPIHEMPPSRTADPAAATKSLAAGSPASPLEDLRVKTLPSGLRVVLAPMTSVRTFEARLIFPAGTAAEPSGKRGVALLAARGLRMNPDDEPLLLRFLANGGAFDVDVEPDRTAFAIHGLAGNLDQSVSALAQLIGDGVYSDLDETRDDLHRDEHTDAHDVLATRLFRRALYGENHPYIDAGLWRRANKVSNADVAAFRATYFVPKGATLVITGGFDADLAARWVDYAFADWRGESPSVRAVPAHPAPLAFAQSRTTSQITFRIAFPLVGIDRARSLVMAEMASLAAGDVRETLAASYGVSATLDETRGGNALVVGGSVDAARAAEAFALLRDRLEHLRDPSADTAIRFVEARARIVDRLESIPASASSLATRLGDALVRAGAPDDDDRTAAAVRALTLDRVRDPLRYIDLGNAAILMLGPDAATDAAYQALGRTATRIH